MKRTTKRQKGETLTLVSLRLPAELIERAEVLLPALRASPDTAGWRATRLGVLRLAIVNGLADLEEAYGRSKAKG